MRSGSPLVSPCKENSSLGKKAEKILKMEGLVKLWGACLFGRPLCASKNLWAHVIQSWWIQQDSFSNQRQTVISLRWKILVLLIYFSYLDLRGSFLYCSHDLVYIHPQLHINLITTVRLCLKNLMYTICIQDMLFALHYLSLFPLILGEG